ncbi:MAG: hypothetical protein Q9227_009387 [Pyrenula ochraceoflavens]
MRKASSLDSGSLPTLKLYTPSSRKRIRFNPAFSFHKRRNLSRLRLPSSSYAPHISSTPELASPTSSSSPPSPGTVHPRASNQQLVGKNGGAKQQERDAKLSRLLGEIDPIDVFDFEDVEPHDATETVSAFTLGMRFGSMITNHLASGDSANDVQLRAKRKHVSKAARASGTTAWWKDARWRKPEAGVLHEKPSIYSDQSFSPTRKASDPFVSSGASKRSSTGSADAPIPAGLNIKRLERADSAWTTDWSNYTFNDNVSEKHDEDSTRNEPAEKHDSDRSQADHIPSKGDIKSNKIGETLNVPQAQDFANPGQPEVQIQTNIPHDRNESWAPPTISIRIDDTHLNPTASPSTTICSSDDESKDVDERHNSVGGSGTRQHGTPRATTLNVLPLQNTPVSDYGTIQRIQELLEQKTSVTRVGLSILVINTLSTVAILLAVLFLFTPPSTSTLSSRNSPTAAAAAAAAQSQQHFSNHIVLPLDNIQLGGSAWSGFVSFRRITN